MDLVAPPDDTADEDGNDLLVGIGASAGGLDALKSFLAALPDQPGYAFALVQHVGEAEGELLSEVFARLTPLPVLAIEDGLPIEPDRFYVAPPNAIVSIKAGQFRLRPPRSGTERRNPIDRFFQALAEARATRAVGIVLSGSGSDGALGLAAIGAAGGMTMAQTPGTAAFADMPASVAAAADHVLPPGELAQVLTAYAEHWRSMAAGSLLHDRRREVQARLSEVCDVLLRRTGHDFKHYKSTTLIRRLERRMQVRGLRDIDDYIGELARDLHEPHVLFRELLIGVTSFFRESDAFAALGERVLATLLRERSETEMVRIWVPGCATGEEAYTIAMLAKEQLAKLENPPKVQIFATDVNERALVVARRGSYPQGITTQVTPERMARYFVKRGRRWQVSDEIREMCLFSVHNLISDPPFSRIDLISCRNLLIYLGSHLQKKLIPLFHYALRAGGYLFLGASESLTGHAELFRVIDAKHRIAQRKDTAIHVPGQLREFSGAGVPGWRASGAATEVDLGAVAQRILLDEFTPRYVIVTEDGQVVFLSEGADIFVQAPAGSFSNNIMRMVRRGLSVGLRTAFNQSIRTRRTVVRDVPGVHTAEGIRSVRLTVQPMPEMGRDDGLYMLVFQDQGVPMRRLDEDGGVHPDADAVIDALERELLRTREDLERTVQDLEAANEELKSSNEELLSMNEELQSANEELETSKEEVQAANQALGAANADLENLLRSTRIATIFLDTAGCIRGLTPAAAEIYNLAPTDIGRPLQHFTHRLKDLAPMPVLEDFADDEPLDVQAQHEDGRWFLRRVLPYRAPDGTRGGLVVTFTDVSRQRHAAEALRSSEETLRVALAAARLGAWERDLATGTMIASPTAKTNLGLHPDEPLTWERLRGLAHPDDLDRLDAAIEATLTEASEFDVEFRVVRSDGIHAWLIARGRALTDEAGRPTKLVGVTVDITERKLAESARHRAERRQAFVLALNDRLRDLEDPRAITSATAEMLGRHLSVARVGYGEVDATAEHVIVDRDWTDETLGSVAGKHRLDAFGPAIIAELKAGFSIRVEDVTQDPRTAESGTAAFASIGTRAVLAVPLIKASRLTALLFLHHPEPHPWADEDLILVQEVAERTWAALERARIEIAMRQTAERLRIATDAASLGVFEWYVTEDRSAWENDRMWAIFGRGRDAPPIGSAEFIERYLHPGDRTRFREALQRSLSGEDIFRVACRIRREDAETRWVEFAGHFERDATGRPVRIVSVLADITERKIAEERRQLLIRELHHRVKNTLATVQAIVGSTARNVSSIEEFYASFVGRIVSLAQTHTLLTEDVWQTASLRALLDAELAPYEGEGRVKLDGPDLDVTSEFAVPMGMAIHELTTNAAKYGALSGPGGRVAITWSAREESGERRLDFLWQEMDGPSVTPPSRQGFGSRLLRRVLGAQLQADVEIDYDPAGLRFRMEAPLKRVTDTLEPEV
jgi:two-component system CheB/CheR fusion protein